MYPLPISRYDLLAGLCIRVNTEEVSGIEVFAERYPDKKRILGRKATRWGLSWRVPDSQMLDPEEYERKQGVSGKDWVLG